MSSHPFYRLCILPIFFLVINGLLVGEIRAESDESGAREMNSDNPSETAKTSKKSKFSPPAGYVLMGPSRKYHGMMVRDIRFAGLKRTRSFRLLNHMDISPGKPFDHDLFDEDMRRLRNKELFYDVRVYVKVEETGLSMLFHMRDKWSMLPYFNFIRGGGSYQVVFGAYDINLFGSMFMMDANFMVFDDQPSGVLYLTVPRLFGLPLDIGADGGLSRTIRTVYGPQTSSWYIYAMESQWINLSVESEPVPWLRLKLWQKFSWNKIRLTKRSPDDEVLPGAGRRAVTGVMLSLGKVTYHNYLMHGLKLTCWASGAFKAMGSAESFLRFTWDMRAYWRLGKKSGNIAARLHGGYIYGGTFLDEHVLGSFSGLRGFKYAQYVGKASVAGSLEYRTGLLPLEFPIVAKFHRIFRGKTLRMQGVAFTEMGSITGSQDHSTRESGELLWSIGTGFRGIFVPFYKAVLRVDVCYTLRPFRSVDLMIATQQAF